MASVMAIGSEVAGVCVEGISIEVSGRDVEYYLVCFEFWLDCLNVFLSLLSGCVDGNDARY